MKAAQFSKYGGVEVIEINNNADEPAVAEGKVLVEIYAASLNPFDNKVRSGVYKDMMPVVFPSTPGGDFAGVVKEVDGKADFKVGDEVYGQALTFSGGSGALAEMGLVNPAKIWYKPGSVNFSQAAALPLVGVSAIQALEEHIKIQNGQKILIHGGAGGIGSIAIQLAKVHGVHVATTVSGDDKEFVKSLGADEAIDYKTEDFSEIINEYDAVFDTVGGETAQKSLKVLKKGGVMVSMVGQFGADAENDRELTLVSQSTNINQDKLKRLSELVDSGKIKVVVDKVFTLDEASSAFEYLEKGHPKGKVVVNIKPV